MKDKNGKKYNILKKRYEITCQEKKISNIGVNEQQAWVKETKHIQLKD